MRILTLALLIQCVISTYSFTQDLVTSEWLQQLSPSEVMDDYGIDTDYSLDFYKITYTTNSILNELDTASGLVIVPDTNFEIFPLLCYQHGTIDSREDVPSRLAGGTALSVTFAAQGYVVTAADYVGLGDSPGNHPYLHAETEATAAIDLMLATRDNISTFDAELSDQVFLTGYSQGGHAAAAAQRTLERDYTDEFTLTASAPMSGPYSLSDVMADFTLGEKNYLFSAYLASTAISMKLAYPDLLDDFELEDIFKSPYVAAMRRFESEEISLFSLNTTLIGLLSGLTTTIHPKDMLQDSVLTAITVDKDHPLLTALQRNDLVDWTPVAPTLLTGCGSDEQVSFENTTLACDTWMDNGATNLMCKNVQSSQNESHVGCVEPAVEEVIAFFDSFRITNSTEEQTLLSSTIWAPNPAVGTIVLQDETYLGMPFELVDINSKSLLNGTIDQTRLDIGGIAPGVYYIKILDEDILRVQKVVVAK